jgi:hypothetical protein
MNIKRLGAKEFAAWNEAVFPLERNPNSMKERRFKNILRLGAAAVFAVSLSQSILGQQVLYTENFDSPDSANNWTVNAASSRDTAEFAFDYSTVGVPAAPNSGGTTLGLMLRANRPLDVGALSGVSVSPNGQAFTGNYVLEYDLWENFPGPAPGGGAGSTQVTGAGIMTSGSVPHFAGSGDGLWFGATGEGGSGTDYRVYFGGINQATASLYAAGGQNNTAAYYQTNFPGGISAPPAQVALYPMQTNTTAAGTIGWAWHHVKITKSGTTVTWDIDNVRMANVDLSAVTTGGDNILFAQSDINATQTTTDLDPVLFGLIDNVKVTSLPGAPVSAVLMDPNTGVIDTIAEGGTTVASFKITRPSINVVDALPINFTLAGTATRGDAVSGDYFIRTNGMVIPTANAVTIPAGMDNVLIEIVANDDNISELTESVVLDLAAGNGYVPVAPTGGTVSITDNDASTVDILQVVFDQMFEGNTNDLIRFTLQRRGDLGAAPFDVNLSYGGTATVGTDYTPVTTVTFNPGDVTTTVDVHPLNDSTTESRETVILSIGTGTGYTAGTNSVLTTGATAVIVDDDVEDGTALFADNFDTDSSGNWTVLFGSLNPDSQDFTASFGFDYGQDGFAVPAAPHSNGDTHGLLMSVNKLDLLTEAAGVNAYPIGKDFTGNYAVRFDMYLMQNASAGTTENAIFGVDHTGTKTNWYSNSAGGVTAGWEFDGIWASVVADASALPGDPRARDYQIFAGAGTSLGTPPLYGPTLVASREAPSLANVFHQPPWTPGGGAGSPGNTPITETPSWAQVELRHENGIVTLTINNTNILSYTNSTGTTHGNIMLGYNDAYNSIGSGGGGLVIYDNLRVVPLESVVPEEIRITSISRSGNTVTIDFTGPSGQVVNGPKLYSAPTVTGPFVEDTTATVTSLGGSNYRATTTSTDPMRFFIIRAHD